MQTRHSCNKSRLLIFCVVVLLVSCFKTVLAHNNKTSNKQLAISIGAAPNKYAACVIDFRNRKVLFGRNLKHSRHPASLTKIMTLYLLFDELRSGRISLDTRMRVSLHAAAQPSSKLWLRANERIKVKNAIQAVALRSANDAAVVIAEHLASSERAFAKKMTLKARELGMMKTHFHNASGLHHARQITTACDMAILGVALKKHFPSYYKRFIATSSFKYKGALLRNTNRLLNTKRGIDGIKTGYTSTSGFNLLSSAAQEQRSIVAAVMGFSSSASRDNYMLQLLNKHLPRASVNSGIPTTIAFVINTNKRMPFPKKSTRTSDMRGSNIAEMIVGLSNKRMTFPKKSARTSDMRGSNVAEMIVGLPSNKRMLPTVVKQYEIKTKEIQKEQILEPRALYGLFGSAVVSAPHIKPSQDTVPAKFELIKKNARPTRRPAV